MQNLQPNSVILKEKQCIASVKEVLCSLWDKKFNLYNACPQPISINSTHIKESLCKYPYLVAEKSDGVRYLLVLSTYKTKPIAVMIDRSFRMFPVQVVCQKKYFQGTILDGELVWEHSTQQGEPQQIFLVFDMVALSGDSSIQSKSYIDRYKILQSVLNESLDVFTDTKWEEKSIELGKKKQIVCLGNAYALQFRIKPLYKMKYFSSLVSSQKTLFHKSDGFIFTPANEPVRVGKHYHMFKWKRHHTLDFQVRIQYDRKKDTHYFNFGCQNEGKYEILPKHFTFIMNDTLLELLFHTQKKTEYIVECLVNLQEKLIICTPLCIRKDKTTPNDILIIEKTIIDIQDNVKIEDILHVSDIC